MTPLAATATPARTRTGRRLARVASLMAAADPLTGPTPDVRRLDPEDQRFFAEMLISPPPIPSAMERAFAKHRELIRSS